MACITLFAQPMAMATTQLTCVAQRKAATHFVGDGEHHPLRMSWVVVTGNDGSRTLRMKWEAAEDGC